YFTFAYLALTACEIMIFNFELPAILKAQGVEGDSAKLLIRPVVMKALMCLCITNVGLCVIVFGSIIYTGKAAYTQHLPVFFMLMLGVSGYAIQQVFRHWLYVKSHDKQILSISLAMLVVFVVSVFIAVVVLQMPMVTGLALSIMLGSAAALSFSIRY